MYTMFYTYNLYKICISFSCDEGGMRGGLHGHKTVLGGVAAGRL